MSEPQIAEQYEGYREDVAGYRSPAVSAIVTLVLGILSFMAIFQPTLWVFPLVTFGVGFASLYALAKNPLKIGRKAALVGLMLAFFFLAWGSSHYFVRQQWIIHCARQYADAWVGLVGAGQLRDAHQLHLPKASRVGEGTTMDDFYAAHQLARADYVAFFEKPPLKTLLEFGPSPKVVFQRAGFIDILPNRDKLYLDYRTDCQESGGPRSLAMRIVMVRERDPATGELNWYVDSVNEPDANG